MSISLSTDKNYRATWLIHERVTQLVQTRPILALNLTFLSVPRRWTQTSFQLTIPLIHPSLGLILRHFNCAPYLRGWSTGYLPLRIVYARAWRERSFDRRTHNRPSAPRLVFVRQLSHSATGCAHQHHAHEPVVLAFSGKS